MGSSRFDNNDVKKAAEKTAAFYVSIRFASMLQSDLTHLRQSTYLLD